MNNSSTQNPTGNPPNSSNEKVNLSELFENMCYAYTLLSHEEQFSQSNLEYFVSDVQKVRAQMGSSETYMNMWRAAQQSLKEQRQNNPNIVENKDVCSYIVLDSIFEKLDYANGLDMESRQKLLISLRNGVFSPYRTNLNTIYNQNVTQGGKKRKPTKKTKSKKTKKTASKKKKTKSSSKK